MIVRKPYAFFIKHFRLFHFIFVILAFSLVVSNIGLFEFFDDYVSTTPIVISSYVADLTKVNVIWNFILIIGLIIVMGVLIYKKKDIKLYIALIFVYVLVTILFIFSNNTIDNLSKYLVDIRLVKAIHDMLLVIVFVQAVMVALLFARATGFDIKKFDFARDYAKLNVSSEDREEVELNLEFDFNVFKTKVNKFVRNFKYFYLENKLVCFIIFGVSLLVICFSVYGYYKNSPYVSVSGTINSSKYLIDIGRVFVDNSDMSDSLIDGSNYVILNASVGIKSGSRNTFNTSNLMLIIGNDSFVPLRRYNQYFSDFGTPYNDNVIEGSGSYYFIYRIPSNVSFDDVRLVYVDINRYFEMDIDFIDLRQNEFVSNSGVGDNVLISSDFNLDVDFKIDEVSFKEKFLVPYIYKVSNEFYSSSYYVSPSIKGNYDKSVVRFRSNNCDFISRYGSIYYDGVKSKVSLKKIDSRSSEYCYYETDFDVLSASRVYLNLNVRGKLYNYYLK